MNEMVYDEMDNLQFGKRFILLSELFNFVARKKSLKCSAVAHQPQTMEHFIKQNFANLLLICVKMWLPPPPQLLKGAHKPHIKMFAFCLTW